MQMCVYVCTHVMSSNVGSRQNSNRRTRTNGTLVGCLKPETDGNKLGGSDENMNHHEFWIIWMIWMCDDAWEGWIYKSPRKPR